MEMPSPDTPAEAYLSRSAYTIARVAADSNTAGLEQALVAKHAELKTALRQRDDLREDVQKKAAVLDVADNQCDDDVEQFELHLLGAVKKNREHLKYRRYFNHGLRDVTTAEPRKEEPELIADMLDAMNDDKTDADIGAVVTLWQPKLTASRANVLAADEQLTAAEKTLAILDDKTLPALMAAWREEYKKLEGGLTTAYASTPKMVARFFKPFRKNRKTTT